MLDTRFQKLQQHQLVKCKDILHPRTLVSLRLFVFANLLVLLLLLLLQIG